VTRNPDVAFAEAIAELARRLQGWGVAEPQREAQDFVQGMVHQGWRPNGMRLEQPPAVDPRYDRKPDEVPEYLAAKAALRGVRPAEEDPVGSR